VQVTAVARPNINLNPLFNGSVLNKSCPRNQFLYGYQASRPFSGGFFVFR